MDESTSIIVWCIIGITLILAIGGTTSISNCSYKQGQIDAINGNIRYQLITNQNREIIWKEISGGTK